MSKAEQLALKILKEKVEALKSSQSIQALIESMGFFALKEAVEEAVLTIQDQKSTLISYAQGFILALSEKTTHKNKNSPRKRVTRNVRSSLKAA